MISIFILLLQNVLSKDLIYEMQGHFFERIKNDECYYLEKYTSIKYHFSSVDRVTSTRYLTENCTGEGITKTESLAN